MIKQKKERILKKKETHKMKRYLLLIMTFFTFALASCDKYDELLGFQMIN